MNPFTSKVMVSIVHPSLRVNEATCLRRLRKMRNAMTVASGAIKMYQKKKVSAILHLGQKGRRPIEGEKRKSANASRHGEHQANTTLMSFR